MKIGLFIPNATFDLPGSAEVGGIEVYAFELGEALQKRGHQVVLFGGDPKAGKRHRETGLRLSLHPYVETKDILKLGTRFRKLVQRWRFGSSSMAAVQSANCDVIFVFKPYDFLNAWRWKRRGVQARVVMNYQGKDFFQTDRYWKRFIDWEYAASADNAKLAGERYGAIPEVFPNGVDTDLFRPPAKHSERENLKVLTAGRMVGWKGLEYLLAAVAKAPGVQLELAGDGPERPKLEAQAEAFGIRSRTNFLGVLGVRELAAAMAGADAFAQPSIDFDACPTAVLQALSSGLVVLMSDQVGLRKYFPSPQSSVHLPARDSAAWGAALTQVANAALESRSAIGSCARNIILEQFSWNSIAAKIEQKLEQLARNTGGRM